MRNGRNETSRGGDRYKCRGCKKSVTWRNGALVGGLEAKTVADVNFGAMPGRPVIKDLRTAA